MSIGQKVIAITRGISYCPPDKAYYPRPKGACPGSRLTALALFKLIETPRPAFTQTNEAPAIFNRNTQA